MKVILIVLSIGLISSCSDTQNQIDDLRREVESVERKASNIKDVVEVKDPVTNTNTQKSNDEAVSPTSEWSYKVVSISEKNWGYQLYQNGTMIINQTSIPSMPGIEGFSSEEKAERTAEHILTKLKNGVFPPTVNKKELDSLNVLRD